MTTAYEIPLTADPQKLRINLSGANYVLQFYWSTKGSCWIFNLLDESEAPLIMGAPVITGANLLGQYAYLGINGALMVQTDHDPDAVPTLTNLGQEGHVYFVVP